MIDVEADLVGIERLGAIDVGHGHVHELELVVGHQIIVPGDSDAVAPTSRSRQVS
jgi:hypothetical protein